MDATSALRQILGPAAVYAGLNLLPRLDFLTSLSWTIILLCFLGGAIKGRLTALFLVPSAAALWLASFPRSDDLLFESVLVTGSWFFFLTLVPAAAGLVICSVFEVYVLKHD